MAFKHLRNISRDTNWGVELKDGESASTSLVELGCMLRIADATELMAKRYSELLDERDQYQRWYRDEKAVKEKAQHSNSALRGVITRQKKEIEELKDQLRKAHYVPIEESPPPLGGAVE